MIVFVNVYLVQSSGFLSSSDSRISKSCGTGNIQYCLLCFFWQFWWHCISTMPFREKWTKGMLSRPPVCSRKFVSFLSYVINRECSTSPNLLILLRLRIVCFIMEIGSVVDRLIRSHTGWFTFVCLSCKNMHTGITEMHICWDLV